MLASMGFHLSGVLWPVLLSVSMFSLGVAPESVVRSSGRWKFRYFERPGVNIVLGRRSCVSAISALIIVSVREHRSSFTDARFRNMLGPSSRGPNPRLFALTVSISHHGPSRAMPKANSFRRACYCSWALWCSDWPFRSAGWRLTGFTTPCDLRIPRYSLLRQRPKALVTLLEQPS